MTTYYSENERTRITYLMGRMLALAEIAEATHGDTTSENLRHAAEELQSLLLPRCEPTARANDE